MLEFGPIFNLKNININFKLTFIQNFLLYINSMMQRHKFWLHQHCPEKFHINYCNNLLFMFSNVNTRICSSPNSNYVGVANRAKSKFGNEWKRVLLSATRLTNLLDNWLRQVITHYTIEYCGPRMEVYLYYI